MNPSFLAPTVGNSVPDLGATGQITSSANVYLAPSSLGYQNIVITVAGQSVFLPPAYATVPGPSSYTIKNSGGYPFGVRDSSGVLITAISPSGAATFFLDNVTNWSYTGTGIQPGLVTVDVAAGNPFTNTIPVPYVTFDSNTSVHFLNLTTGGFSAFVADNISKTFSTAVSVSATLGPPVAAFKISSTTLIVFYQQDANNHLAVVLTLTGIPGSYSISVGTPATLTVVGGMNSWGGETSLSQPHIAQLTPTLYVASFVPGANNTSVAAISVSGTTVTIGAIANIITANSVSDTTTCYPISATTALVIYNVSTGTPNIFAVVISVSGTTCTVGTPASIPGTNDATNTTASCQLTPTKFLTLVNNSTTSAIINAITVTGTTVSVGASFTLETGISGFNNAVTTYGPGYNQGGATRFNPKLFPISTTTAFIWYMDNGNNSRCAILTENSGTVTGGTILYRSISAVGFADNQGGLMLPPGTSEFIAIKQDGFAAANVYTHRLICHKISGSTITVGQTTPLPTLNTRPTSQNNVAIRMNSGDYILGLSPSDGPADTISVFRTNGDAFTVRGNIDVPGLIGYTFGAAKPASNRLVLIGSSIFSGNITAASTTSPRVLMVELAQ